MFTGISLGIILSVSKCIESGQDTKEPSKVQERTVAAKQGMTELQAVSQLINQAENNTIDLDISDSLASEEQSTNLDLE
jgi:hypothetical protein